MEEIVFNSADELYNRLLPALKSKKRILSKSGYSYINEIDIWNTLRYGKWNRINGLMLCDMVEDILHTDNKEFNNYYQNKYRVIVGNDDEVLDLPKVKEN